MIGIKQYNWLQIIVKPYFLKFLIRYIERRGKQNSGFRYNWFEITARPYFQRFLSRYKGKSELRFLEIGPFEGMATVWMLENILTDNGCRILVIDTFEGSQEHNKETLGNLLEIFKGNIERWEDKVDIIVGRSQVDLTNMDLGETFDFIYIDGSHIATDVYTDAIHGFRKLKKGGYMAFDDYDWFGVTGKKEDTPKPGIDRFLSEKNGQYRLLLKEYQVWVEKI